MARLACPSAHLETIMPLLTQPPLLVVRTVAEILLRAYHDGRSVNERTRPAPAVLALVETCPLAIAAHLA